MSTSMPMQPLKWIFGFKLVPIYWPLYLFCYMSYLDTNLDNLPKNVVIVKLIKTIRGKIKLKKPF